MNIFDYNFCNYRILSGACKQIRVFHCLLLIVFVSIIGTGCKKLVEVNAPITNVTQKTVYNSDATANAVLTNLYAKLSAADIPGGGLTSLSLFPGLSADELTLLNGLNKPDLFACYTNSLTNSNAGAADYWTSIYPKIYVANAAIEGLNASVGLTPAVKEQLLGEAKFMRAFLYFYLVNLYGDVPLVTSTDYTQNASIGKTPKAQIWKQILSDLTEAGSILNEDFLDISLLTATDERVRPTKWAAAALLARSRLYTADWAGAEVISTELINHSALFELEDLDNVFLKNNKEAIWQLQPVNIGINTPNGRFFVLPASGPDNDHPVYLSESLLGSFEAGDERRGKWVGTVDLPGVKTYHYPYKYKVSEFFAPVTEYGVVLRLGEQYLIRAEARARQGHLVAAAEDLNAIRRRAGLLDYSGVMNQTSLLEAIQQERRVELFSEWGNRWFDLKRTNIVDAVMRTETVLKGGAWSSYKQLYPIPLNELLLAPKIVQNEGY